MGLFIANKDYAITIIPGGIWIPGTPTYIETTTTKSKILNKACLITILTWTMVGCTMPPNVFIAGLGTMSPTGSKCFMESQLPLRLTDNGKCMGSFQPPVGPSIPCNCTFMITNAGQTKVMCN